MCWCRNISVICHCSSLACRIAMPFCREIEKLIVFFYSLTHTSFRKDTLQSKICNTFNKLLIWLNDVLCKCKFLVSHSINQSRIPPEKRLLPEFCIDFRPYPASRELSQSRNLWDFFHKSLILWLKKALSRIQWKPIGGTNREIRNLKKYASALLQYIITNGGWC